MNGPPGRGNRNDAPEHAADLRARRLVVALFALLLLAFDCGAVEHQVSLTDMPRAITLSAR